MKKAFLVLAIALVCTNSISATKITGYFISTSNDTVRVTFDIPFGDSGPFCSNLQFRIKYFDAANQKHILKPDMAKEVVFEHEGKVFRMLKQDPDEDLLSGLAPDQGNMFLQVVKEGKLKMYRYFHQSVSSASATSSIPTMNSSSYFFLQKNDDKLFANGFGSFKKDMVGYFSDCPELAKKIENKVYIYADIELIVDEYNKTCTP